MSERNMGQVVPFRLSPGKLRRSAYEHRRKGHPMEAVERIEAAAKEAAAKASQCVVPMPEHFHMEIDFTKHTMAAGKRWYPGATLKDDKFVCFDTDDWFEMLRFCRFVLSDG
jgi:D-amino peptidase